MTMHRINDIIQLRAKVDFRDWFTVDRIPVQLSIGYCDIQKPRVFCIKLVMFALPETNYNNLGKLDRVVRQLEVYGVPVVIAMPLGGRFVNHLLSRGYELNRGRLVKKP
jgi:hypothetical protein